MQSEKIIQTQCLNYLEWLEAQGKLYAYRTQAGAVKTVRPNGSSGFMKTGKPGVPDITCLLPDGRYMGIELKTTKGKLSPAQADAQERISKLGGYYVVIRSLDELISSLKDLNII